MKLFLRASIVFLLLLAAPAHAQDEKQLKSLEQSMAEAAKRREALEAEAKALGAELERITQKMVDVAAELQAQETSLTRIEIELQVLEEDVAIQRAQLETKRADLAKTLAGMQKLSRQPVSLAFLRPVSARETTHSAALLSGVVPVLEQQAGIIRSELAALETLKYQLENTRATYRLELAALEENRTALSGLQSERKARRAEVSNAAKMEAERIAKLAKEAKSLSELLATLKEERRKIAAIPRPKPKPKGLPVDTTRPPRPLFSEARGQMPLPVVGRVIGDYGQPYNGLESEGLWVAARVGATVVAPYDGQIVFADNFRSYGRLLIIEHSEGYHSVIAGLEKADVEVGQRVIAGEPVGTMGTSAEQMVASNNPLGLPVLYIELQRNGRSVNPRPWLAASLENASR